MKLIRALQDDAIRRRVEKRYDPESMAVTGRLLEINPEVFTAWNFRREAIVELAARAEKAEAEARRRADGHSTWITDDDDDDDAAGGVGVSGLSLGENRADDDVTPPPAAVDSSSATAANKGGEGEGGGGGGGDKSSPSSSPPPPPPPPPFVPHLRDELALTEKTLRKNPKSYPSWHHRKWTVHRLVEQARARAAAARLFTHSVPGTTAAADTTTTTEEEDDQEEKSILSREMKLIAHLLDLDDRNFHCWGYRRFVVSLRGAPDAEELDYTTSKIEANFSNYSAWHHRSTYLPRVHGVAAVNGSGGQTAAADQAKDADHADRDNRTTATDSRTTDAGADRAPDRGETTSTTMRLPRDVLDAEYELVQQAFFTEPEDQSGWMYHRWLLGNTLSGSSGGGGGAREGEGEGRVEGREMKEGKKSGGDHDDGTAAAAAEEEEKDDDDEVVLEVLEREADLCRQLIDMEPDSKWPVVTLARLCRATGSAESLRESAGSFERLKGLDPMRAGYYCDCCR